MAEIVGKNARVKCAANVIEGIRSWTIDYTADTPETTDFDDSGHRTYLAGLDGWTGSFEGFGQPGWDTDAGLGTQYKGIFYVSASTGHCYSGSVIITGTNPSVAVDGVNMVSYTFQGTAGLSYT